MALPQFFPPFDPDTSDDADAGSDYAQAVRIGDRIETSGVGGWDDNRVFPVALADEITQTFDNLGSILAGVGARWESVVAIESWHLPLDEATFALMVAQFRRRMPTHRPIWTALAVPGFGLPGMRVEIRLTAIVPNVPDEGGP